MTATQSLRLYELTLEFVKDTAKAKEYVTRIEETIDEKFAQRESILATKVDIGLLKTDIAEAKADMIKWMFLFWAGSTIATICGLIAIVRFMIIK